MYGNKTVCYTVGLTRPRQGIDIIMGVIGLLGAVAGTGRRLRRDEDPSSGLASLRTSELFLRIARVRRNEAQLSDESVCSRRGHWRTAHV